MKHLFKKSISVLLSVIMLMSSCSVLVTFAADDGISDGVKCTECEEFIIVNAVPAKCETDGYTGDKVCAECGFVYEKGEIIPAYKHTFVSTPVEIIEATCTSKRTLIYKCKYCSETKAEVVGDFDAHHIVVVSESEPTCDKPGYYAYFCMVCHTKVEVIKTEPTGHVDENMDGKCDIFGCGGVVASASKTSKCTCLCHDESPLMGFVYKIISFIWKILGTSKECECGVVHY